MDPVERQPEIDPSARNATNAASPSIFRLGGQLGRRDVLRLAGSVAGLAAIEAVLAACGGTPATTAPQATTATGGAPTAAAGGASTAGATAARATSAAGSPAASPASSPVGAPAQAKAKLVNGGGTAPAGIAGEVKIALAFDPASLDPIGTYTLNNGRWQENVFSPLVWRDTNLVLYDGKDGHPQPSEGFGLAESWQYLDDKTLEMKLRTGVTFHNGETFDATSVQSTFTRLLDKANKSPQTFNYTSIDTVEVVDPRTVKFHFKEVDPVMITKLAGYGAFITPANATKDATKYAAEAPGTGPYKVTKYTKDNQLVLDAWDGYWGPRKPHIKTLTYRIIPDDNTRLSEFLAGSVDVLTLNVSQASAAKGNPNVSIVDIGVPTVSGLRLDAKQAPTDKREVRQAIAHALDMKTIISTILGGYATQVGVWQSPFSFGFEDLPPYTYDPAKSKDLLKTAGVTTPVKVTYDVIGADTQAKEMANAVKTMLDAVGFQVDIRLRERATFFSDYQAGKLGNIVPFGWGGWTLDYDNTYYSMHFTGQSYNPSYSNPAVDKLLNEERGTLDQAKRLQVAKEVNKLLYDDAIDVGLYQNTYVWGISNRVRNFSIPPDERLWWLDSWIQG